MSAPVYIELSGPDPEGFYCAQIGRCGRPHYRRCADKAIDDALGERESLGSLLVEFGHVCLTLLDKRAGTTIAIVAPTEREREGGGYG